MQQVETTGNLLKGFFHPLIALTIITCSSIIFSYAINESQAEESYRGVLIGRCTFSYVDQIEDRFLNNCYPRINSVVPSPEGNLPLSSEETRVLDPVPPSVVMNAHNSSRFWKSEVVSSTIPQMRYDNIGEPSFASNGTLVFYAGNHFAARSTIGNDWKYVDPYFDFKGVIETNATDSNASRQVELLFKADQHVEYDPAREMYLWIRQGEQVRIGGGQSNIDRIAVSRDLDRWAARDLISMDILHEAGVIGALFDYPDTVLTNKYLYLTTSVHAANNTQYGLIFRFPLNELNNMLDQSEENPADVHYEFILDKAVKTITPIDGATDPMYFGAHLPANSSMMKIYTWFDDSSYNSTQIPITPWNSIKNVVACDKYPQAWWCKANTSSRIRSAWMSQNSINFQWNAVVSHDGGSSWVPYIDSATFHVNDSMRYERKYHLADQSTPWMFGAVSPDKQGYLGVGAFYVDTRYSDSLSSPYINYAFGVFNNTEDRWEMMPVPNSSAKLPVSDEEGDPDYTIGDFLTTKAHVGGDNTYSWDAGGYVIVGPHYNNTKPYYFMIKD